MKVCLVYVLVKSMKWMNIIADDEQIYYMIKIFTITYTRLHIILAYCI